jgi:hypothetical protein
MANNISFLFEVPPCLGYEGCQMKTCDFDGEFGKNCHENHRKTENLFYEIG